MCLIYIANTEIQTWKEYIKYQGMSNQFLLCKKMLSKIRIFLA